MRRASAELVASAPYDRDPATIEAARQELERAVAAARQEAHEMGLAAGRAAGRDEAFREVEQTKVQAPPDVDIARLADAMRAIDAARSLTEMLDALVRIASRDASGVELWLLRGGQLHRWPTTGTDDDRAPAALSSDGIGPVAEASRTNSTVRDDEMLAIPIALDGQVVAVFSANPAARMDTPEPRIDVLELLVRYTARSLEALTAFKTARALTQPPVAPVADASHAKADQGQGHSEEDISARRYARLLVSEIKLYHEPAVVDGRRDRDLAMRLGGEIARARVMYEQRVPLHVRARTDYFQDELVRTLADGDAGLLELRAENLEPK
ncbi:MAG: hypothetical protein ACRD2I_04195 [Vicinamibacterales bacterium]